jgi:hypothetical protein
MGYVTTAPTQGCFGFEDNTRNWFQWYKTLPLPATGGSWWPVTTEYVVETATQVSGYSQRFGFNQMLGYALDQNQAPHSDPGNSAGTDPYIDTMETDTNGTACAGALWNNSTINSPQDPMWFLPNDCGPHY